MKQTELIVEGFLRFLKNNKQLDLLPQIVTLLAQKIKTGPQLATVITVKELSISNKNSLQKLLQEQYGISETEFKTDERLLGGMKVYLRDTLLDLSTRGRIEGISKIVGS